MSARNVSINSSWKLLSSATVIVLSLVCPTSEISGVPIFPARIVGTPALFKMCAINEVVVVLPFEPVIPIIRPFKKRSASSISLQMVTPSARAKGVTIWSEIELADRFLKGRMIGITGSNGKTTTTSLIAHILKSAGVPTILAGNIGTPLISEVGQTSDKTITVAELSSFQLELIDTFRADISLFLNLTPDHLDRHHTLEAYGAAKARIFENQTDSDSAVLNADDPAIRPYAPTKPQVFWFSRKQRVAQGAFVSESEIVFRKEGQDELVLKLEDIPLAGAHNVENVLAAVAAARLAGAQ